MISDKNLKENLIVTREGGDRRRQRMLMVLLVIAVIITAVIYGRQFKNRWQHKEQKRQVAVVKPKTFPRDPGQQLMPQLRTLVDDKALVQAREKGYEILEKSKDPAVIDEVESVLGTINMELLLTPIAMPEKETYLVSSGDSLERIAKKFGTTVALIRKSNAITRDMIHPGDRLRIFSGSFSIHISKSRNDLVLNMNDRFFKRYRAGTGKYGTTPSGAFVISDKIVEPPWWRPDGNVVPYGDKENILGTRWMSIKAVEGTDDVSGYGIHGTFDPDTVGKQSSEGCVRLLNSAVEELFVLVPIGTRVIISE